LLRNYCRGFGPHGHHARKDAVFRELTVDAGTTTRCRDAGAELLPGAVQQRPRCHRLLVPAYLDPAYGIQD
jgi:hypothetical protein